MLSNSPYHNFSLTLAIPFQYNVSLLLFLGRSCLKNVDIRGENKRYKTILVFFSWCLETAGLSKNQKLILKFLDVKPEMTTREIAEMVFGKLVEYKTKEYSSISRSLRSLERRGLIRRVHVQLRWRLKSQR
jgi:DNA-binding transcriptional ArsR family regulator